MCISASVRDIVVEILFRDLEYLIDKYMTDMRKVVYTVVQYVYSLNPRPYFLMLIFFSNFFPLQGFCRMYWDDELDSHDS